MKKCGLVIILVISMLIISGCGKNYIERWPKDFMNITYKEDGTCSGAAKIYNCSYTRDPSDSRIINVKYIHQYETTGYSNSPSCPFCIVTRKKSENVTKTLYIDDDGALIEYKDKDNNVDDYIQQINIDQLSSIFNSQSKSVIYLGYTACKYCTSYSETLQMILPKYKLKIYYIDTRKIDINMPKGYPTTYIVQKGSIVDTVEGEMDKDEIIKFLQNNNIID